MTAVAPIVVFLFFLAPAVRLLRLASRTRQAPELWCGLYFLGASIGLPLRILGVSLQLAEPETSRMLHVFGHAAFGGGCLAIAIFTWRVFHPESPNARRFIGALALAIAATAVWSFTGGYLITDNPAAILTSNAIMILPTAWAFHASLGYWRAMKKRTALGLADPVLTNRFFLWSIWTGGVTALPAFALVARSVLLVAFYSGTVTMADADTVQSVALGLLRVVALVSVPATVVALTLAFFPPRPYLARIRSRATNEA